MKYGLRPRNTVRSGRCQMCDYSPCQKKCCKDGIAYQIEKGSLNWASDPAWPGRLPGIRKALELDMAVAECNTNIV